MPHARVAVLLVTLANMLSYADRMLLPALMQPIKLEFALSDTQLGLLTGFAFAALYAFSGIPIAALADRGSRRTILAVCLAFWSVMTAACGAARNYAQLLIARMAVGVGESGCTPASLSLLGDYFPPEKRASAVAWFGLGASLGMTFGLTFGAWLGAELGWRGAFYVFCIPGLLLAVSIRIWLRDPQRPASGSVRLAPLRQLADIGALLTENRAFRWALLASIAQGFLMQGVVQWMPSFFIRTHGISLQAAGAWTGLTAGVGLGLGTLLGGYLGDRVALRGLERHQTLCSRMMVALSIGYAFVLWMPTPTLAFGALFVSSIVSGTTLSPSLATILNVSRPDMRSTATAVNVLAVGLLGVGSAPVLIGSLADYLQPEFGDAALRYGLSVACIVSLVGAALHARTASAMKLQGI